MAVDPKGAAHSLARRIEGATAKDVRSRMAGIDMARLPSVAEARAAQYERHGRPEPIKAPSRRRSGPARERGPSHAGRQTGLQTVRVIGSVARPAAGAARAAGGLLKGVGKIAGGVANVFESLLGGGPGKKHGGRGKDVDRIPLDQGPPAPSASEEAQRQEQEQRAARRQKYLRTFSREVPDELQRDADIERDRKGRERTRGE